MAGREKERHTLPPMAAVPPGQAAEVLLIKKLVRLGYNAHVRCLCGIIIRAVPQQPACLATEP